MDDIRPYPGHPYYGVTADGRVFRTHPGPFKRPVPRELKPFFARGYAYVSLSGPGGVQKKAVHRMVAETFLGPCPPGMEAAHNNGVRQDNRAENLRWDSRAANLADRNLHGTHNKGERHGAAKLTESDVLEIRGSPAPGARLASVFGVTPSTISDIRARRSWAHV